MVTKAIIQSIDSNSNKCTVRIPLFETAANPNPVEAKALINIAPGLFNNLQAGDIVIIAFEENKMECPIVLGKLFINVDTEDNINGGSGIFNTIKVRSEATIPASTVYSFPNIIKNDYVRMNTPKKMADYLKWLENFTKNIVGKLTNHFNCLKNWVQWQLRPENVEIDDGDLDATNITEPFLYQNEGDNCDICGEACTKNKKRIYTEIQLDKSYPEL